MAEKEGDLIFPMKLEVDPTNFKSGWENVEPKLQAIIDAKPLRARIEIDSAALKDAVAQLSKLQAGGVKPSTTASMLIASTKAGILIENQAIKAKQANVLETNKLRISNANAEKSELALERAKQRGIAAVHTQNKAYQAQRGVLNGLPQFINSYISILGAYRLGQNIVQTTAEFEMQRVALAAIIRDKSKADELFAKDVELGLQSPFQIKELITYTKQLAAYRIETDSLYDTTKRLADISAGLGVGMDRLVLAYGQVKAASVLRGQEVRQFTEAGIPLIELLADKFTKLNGVATSTADVFKIISERGVSFEMVKSVFDDMTNAGGMFYRMQEIQAQTLKGSLSNLTDAYQKMFMQIGNEGMGPMKGLIDGLRELMNNWKVVSDVVVDVAVGFGVAKLAIIAYNAALGKENAANIASVKTSNAKRASALLQASAYRTLTEEEQAQIMYAGAMRTSDWELMAAEGKLTKDQALRMIAMRKMTVMQAQNIASTVGMTDAEIFQAAATKKGVVMRNMAIASVKAFTASIWASTKAILANPTTWMVAGIALAVKGIMSYMSYRKKYNELEAESVKLSKQYANEMITAYEDIRETVEKGIAADADEKAITSARASLEQIIKKNEELKPIVEARLANLVTEAEKLTEIKKIWDEIKTTAESGSANPAILVSAQDATGSVFNKDIVQNSVSLANAIEKIIDQMIKMSGQGGLNTQGIRKQLEDTKEKFNSGEISIEKYLQVLNEINKFAEKNKNLPGGTLEDIKSWSKLSEKVSVAKYSIGGLQTDVKKFYQVLANEYKLNEKKFNFGLSQEKYNELLVQISLAKSAWTSAFSDIEKAGLPVINNVMNRMFRIPFKPKSGTQTSKDAEGYNKMIDKYKLTSIPKLTKDDLSNPEVTDQTMLEKTTNAWKDRTETLKRYNNEVSAGNKKHIAEIPRLKKEVSDLYKMYKLLGGEPEKDKKDKKTDPRIAMLSNQLKTLREAYSKYLDIRKDIGDAAARVEITKLYGGQMTGVGIAKVPELSRALSLAFSASDFESASKLIEKGFRALGSDATDELRDAILKRTDTSFDEIAANFKRNLDEMGRKIEQTQRANEFFEKMLGLTGSEEAAARLTKAMGMTVGDVRSGYYNALSEIMGHDYMQGVDLGDVTQTQDAINRMRADGFEAAADAAQAQLDGLVDYEQKSLETIYNATDEFLTAEQKKVKIAQDTAKMLKEIENNPNLTPEEKKTRGAAVTAGGVGAKVRVDLEEIQKTEEYVAAFDDLSRTGGMALDGIYAKLEEISKKTGILPSDLKEVRDLMQKIRDQKEQANPFTAWNDAVEQYKLALADIEKNGITKTNQTSLVASAEKLTAAGQNIASAFSTVIAPLQKTVTLAEDVAESFGFAFGDETKSAIDDFMKGFELMSAGIEVVNSLLAANDVITKMAAASKSTLTTTNVAAAGSEVALGASAAGASVGFDVLAASIWAAMAPLWPLLAVAAAVGIAIALINAKAKKQEKIQENLANKIKDLDDAYQKLQHTAERALGSDYLEAVQKEQTLLLEQEKLALAQAQAERDKGRKRDLEKEKEYLRQAADYKQQAADKDEEIMAKFTGYSGITEAALDFANAWLDAYASFASTTDAMTEKFAEMTKNMVVQSYLAKMMQKELQPVFDAIDKAWEDGKMTAEEWKGIQNMEATATIVIDNKARTAVESMGVDVRVSDKSLSGISASVSSMSEDSANTLGGYLNSNLMQLVLQTGLQNRIALAVEAGNVQKPLADIYAIQTQSLAAINSIKADTAIMVSKLTRMVENQDSSMIQGGQKAVNVRLLN